MEGILDANKKLLTELLPHLREWVDRKIAVIKKDDLAQILEESGFHNSSDGIARFKDIAAKSTNVKRSVAEKDSSLVQLVLQQAHIA